MFWDRILPKPEPESIGYQILGVLFVVVLQTTILSWFWQKGIAIDIITPWIIFSLVCHTSWRAHLITAFASLALETHLSVPVGLILCPYFCYTVLILNIRHHISWQRPLSWFTVFICLQIFNQKIYLKQESHYLPLLNVLDGKDLCMIYLKSKIALWD